MARPRASAGSRCSRRTGRRSAKRASRRGQVAAIRRRRAASRLEAVDGRRQAQQGGENARGSGLARLFGALRVRARRAHPVFARARPRRRDARQMTPGLGPATPLLSPRRARGDRSSVGDHRGGTRARHGRSAGPRVGPAGGSPFSWGGEADCEVITAPPATFCGGRRRGGATRLSCRTSDVRPGAAATSGAASRHASVTRRGHPSCLGRDAPHASPGPLDRGIQPVAATVVVQSAGAAA